jgi:hypothetical protein
LQNSSPRGPVDNGSPSFGQATGGVEASALASLALSSMIEMSCSHDIGQPRAALRRVDAFEIVTGVLS